MPQVVSSDGTAIAYDVYGSGPALIYITGASCFRSFWPIVQDAKTFAKGLPSTTTTVVAAATAPTPNPTPLRVRSTTLRQ